MKNLVFKVLCITVISLVLCSCSKKETANLPAKSVSKDAKSELTYLICQRCGGTGSCQACSGTGANIQGSACYTCGGSGRCSYCNGQGYY